MAEFVALLREVPESTLRDGIRAALWEMKDDIEQLTPARSLNSGGESVH